MTKTKKLAVVQEKLCVACGSCIKVCKRNAIHIPNGIYAMIDKTLCVGCGLCAKECPATVIQINRTEEMIKNEK